MTDAGRLDVVLVPAEGIDFDGLARSAVDFEAYGTTFHAAELADIIRMKEAADRPQDRQDVIIIREMIRRRDAAEAGEAAEKA